jgi:hypothetical protein
MTRLPDDEPTLASIRAQFPDADVLRTSNGMNYAKHDAVVIAADLSTTVLAEQVRDYFERQSRDENGGCSV